MERVSGRMTIEHMSAQLAGWEVTCDRRRIFLDCYMRMTRNMLTAVERGLFEDAEWVERLLRHFAEYYFDALEACEQGSDAVAKVWAHAHRAAGMPDTTTVQNLLLGVNAHINYDLVFALADVLRPEWDGISEARIELRYRDHCLVNTVIGETVDEVQDQVVERFSPSMDVIDKVGGPIDEWVASWFIRLWREEVWQHAIELLAVDTPADQEALRRRIEMKAMERARLLLLV